MMHGRGARWRRAGMLTLATLLGLGAGCQQKQQRDAGKTYTADQNAAQKGGAAPAGGQNDAKPLDAPADTTNGKESRASDAGTSDATRGQVVTEPGAPVEHEPRPGATKAPPASGPERSSARSSARARD